MSVKNSPEKSSKTGKKRPPPVSPNSVEVENSSKKRKIKASKTGEKRSSSPNSIDENSAKKRKIVETNPTTNKDKKENRSKQRDLRAQRKKKDRKESVFELGIKAKRLWEELRPESCPEDRRSELLKELFQLVSGSISKLIFAHDTVRVIECLMTLGSEDLRQSLFDEMKGQITEMAKDKFASFFVVKLIKYGTKPQRETVVKTFEGQIVPLMKHKIANNIVELFYNDYANAPQRNRMLQEFCGPEFTRFKEEGIRTVPELISKFPDKEKDIRKHLFNNVTTLINKGCYNHSLVHTVIYNFLMISNEKERSEVIEQLRDACVHVLHSHDGARLSMMAIWHGTAKDRKSIIKSFKTFVTKIATEEHGHMVLLAVFDAVDDTKFVSKALLSELSSNLDEIVNNKYGLKVLFYLLARRSTVFFHPDVIEKLRSGDGNAHSKKDSDLRYKELLQTVSPAIVQYVIDNLKTMLFTTKTILISAVINYASSNVTELMTTLVRCIKDDVTIVENPGCHIMFKKIIAHDKTRKSNNFFSSILLKELNDVVLESLIKCNRGAFLFVAMYETNISEIQSMIEVKMKPFLKTIQDQTSKGAECLKTKLSLTK